MLRQLGIKSTLTDYGNAQGSSKTVTLVVSSSFVHYLNYTRFWPVDCCACSMAETAVRDYPLQVLL